jgi:hypothetical protein
MRPAEPAGGEEAQGSGGGLWHVARARAELDAAFRAAGEPAAAAHLKLAELHLDRAGWSRAAAAPGVGLEMDWLRRFRPLHDALVR